MTARILQRESEEMEGHLRAIVFPGPEGPLEGLWRGAAVAPCGSAVFAHPHPLHGGTLHNKVVYRAAKALAGAGYGTLRFNFRGVGRSAGRHDEGRGETEDFRAAVAEALRLGGGPVIAGGFSFGAAVALRAIAGDSRVAAYIGIGLPLSTESARSIPFPRVPALFVVGERDHFGPPAQLRAFVGESGRIVEIASADHFLEGRLPELEEAIRRFLAEQPAAVPVR